jgi:hypothetical protein
VRWVQQNPKEISQTPQYETELKAFQAEAEDLLKNGPHPNR